MKRIVLVFSLLTFLGLDLQAQSVSDIDGNIYSIVQIGRQYWMQENLRVTQFDNGSAIPTTTPATLDICAETNPLYQWAYNGDVGNVAAYGRLYTWYTVADGRNICPLGWHVPNNAEWDTLAVYLGGTSNAGGEMKETGMSHWQSPNTGATNSSGFTAVPGGHRMCNGGFLSLNTNAFYWSSTANGTDYGWSWKLFYADTGLDPDPVYGYKDYGFSVRCMSDTLATSLPELNPGTHLKFYPNPAQDAIVLDADLGEDMVLMVIDLTGGIVLEQPLRDGPETIDITDLAPGIYLIQVAGTNGLLQRRVVVE